MKNIKGFLIVIVLVAAIWAGLDYWVRTNYVGDPEEARQAFLASYAPPGERQQAIAANTLAAFEAPGVIAVEHFTGSCGTSEKRGEEDVVALEGNYVLPEFATDATVLLNGWYVRYIHGDHHLRGVQAAIVNVEVNSGTLGWQAYGYLSDKNFDDAYEFCYTYTVIAWNEAELDIHTDNFVAGYGPNWDEQTALFGLRSWSLNSTEGAQRALLPMGFVFQWDNQSKAFPWACFDCPVDHHLLQIAYDLGQRERYIEADGSYAFGLGDPGLTGDADVVDAGYLSWETLGILKDNKRRRDFWLGEWIQTLGGTDIGIIAPPFTVLPIEDPGLFYGCIHGFDEITEERTITNIPFEYAVPMVTGWEIGLGCDDEHVKKLGVRIDEFEYDKPTGESVGTLRYMLTTHGDSGGHYSRHKVSILGIKAAAQQIPQAADVDLLLVPSEFGFCNRNDRGDLVITVQNQGSGDAGPSIASVRFQVDGPDIISSIGTPPLAAGASTDLAFEIPGGCFSADCNFEIAADSSNVLFEPDEDNNRGAGTCIG